MNQTNTGLLKRLKSGNSFYRYLLTGIFISLVDFGFFTLFSVVFGVYELAANALSTTFAMCISYPINRVFVFKAEQKSWLNFFVFLAQTLFTGLVVQSFVITGTVWIGRTYLAFIPDSLILTGSKLVAMGAGAVANYFGYRLIFRKLLQSK